MRRLGFSLTEATLQQVALNHGIDQSIRSMTEAEKAQVRYLAIIEQSTNAQGDLARTFNSSANQLRLASMYVDQLKRAFGNLIVPLATKVLPYLIAFVKVVTKVINSIAKLFGFELPEFDYSSLETGIEVANGVEESLDNASGSAKELKKQLMGFDELNVLNPNTGSTGVDLGGLAGGGFGDLELPEYEFLKDIDDTIDKIVAKMEKWLPLIAAVTGALLLVKFSNSFLNSFGTVSKFLTKFDDLLGLGKNGTLKFAGALGLLAAGLGLNTSAFFDINKESELSVDSFFKLTGGATALAGAMALLGVPLATAAAVGAGISAVFGGVAWATADAVKEVDLFKNSMFETIKIGESTTEALTPVIERFNEVEQALLKIDFQETFNEEDLEVLKTRVSSLSEEILNQMSIERNESLANLEPLKNVLNEEQYNKVIGRSTELYDGLEKVIKDGEYEIYTITENAMNERGYLTDEEYESISKANERMKQATIIAYSETAEESKLILTRLKDENSKISIEQTQKVLEQSAIQRDKTIEDAEMQYAGILNEAEKLKYLADFSDEEYESIIKSAEKAKDEAVKNAEDQYDGMYDAASERFPEINKLIDKETGKSNTNFEKSLKDLGDVVDKNLTKLKDLFSGSSKEVDNFKKTTSNELNVAKDNINSKVGTMIGKFKELYNMVRDVNTQMGNYSTNVARLPSAPNLSNSGKSGRMIEQAVGNIQAFATGGFPTMGQLFIARESGAEMVGKIGSRTAVANNQQIVDAISQGVYRAMVDSQSSGGGEVVVSIDGEKVFKAVKKQATSYRNRTGEFAF